MFKSQPNQIMPVRIIASSYIPKLFSLYKFIDNPNDRLNEIHKVFNSYLETLDKMSKFDPDIDGNTFNSIHEWLADTHINITNDSSDDAVKMSIRIKLGLYYCNIYLSAWMQHYNYTADAKNYVTLKEKMLKEAINTILNLEDLTPELYWYRAALLTIKNGDNRVSLNDFSILVTCLEGLDNYSYKYYKDAIYAWLVSFSGRLSEYPTQEAFQKIDDYYARRPWGYDSLLVGARHAYIVNYELKNMSFFEREKRQILTSNDVAKRSVTINNIKYDINLTSKLLQLFAAHIYPMSKPILSFKIGGLDESQLAVFNEKLQVKLRRNKLINSEGAINGWLDNNGLIVKKIKLQLKQLMIETVEDITEKSLTKKEKDNFLSENDFKTIEREVNDYNSYKEKLSGMETHDALILASLSLSVNHSYGLPAGIRADMVSSIKLAYDFYAKFKKIHEETHSGQLRHKAWFDKAKEIVKDLSNYQIPIIIQVGSPIKPENSYSRHAMYVVLKHLKVEDKWQIIIVNGGGEVDSFHKLVANQNPNDRCQYHYVAFELFKLDSANQEALAHYLYRILSMEFTKTIYNEGPREIGKLFDYHNMLCNLYLRDKKTKDEFFYGYQDKKITAFKRADLAEYFDEQFMGNCTNHNLKRALRIAYDMDDITFGLMADNLVLGCDELISQHLQATNQYSIGSAPTLFAPQKANMAAQDNKTDTSNFRNKGLQI